MQVQPAAQASAQGCFNIREGQPLSDPDERKGGPGWLRPIQRKGMRARQVEYR
jgi:hypothetical protein